MNKTGRIAKNKKERVPKNKDTPNLCKGVENMENRTLIDRLALLLVILGALNWLLVGAFQIDVVAMMFTGATSMMSRIVYIAIGLSGLYSISLLFRSSERART